jgi:hypothetical protein
MPHTSPEQHCKPLYVHRAQIVHWPHVRDAQLAPSAPASRAGGAEAQPTDMQGYFFEWSDVQRAQHCKGRSDLTASPRLTHHVCCGEHSAQSCRRASTLGTRNRLEKRCGNGHGTHQAATAGRGRRLGVPSSQVKSIQSTLFDLNLMVLVQHSLTLCLL